MDNRTEIIDRLGDVSDAIAALETLPGARFAVDITVQMHHHAGDGYTNRDLVDVAEKLGLWLDLVAKTRKPGRLSLESLVTVTSGTTTVNAYLVTQVTPVDPINLDI